MRQINLEQEQFWNGAFGNEYIKRNQDKKSNIALFAKILARTGKISSILEVGSNIGLNLEAIQLLNPNIELSAIEINDQAVEILREKGNIQIYHQSVLDFVPDFPRDLVLVKGVLIHIDPAALPEVYEILYQSSSRYICIAEYYHPTPVMVTYRGHENKLFKRDFAGEILDRYPDLKLVDYGFVYHRDPNFPLDDINWFLLEKSNSQ